MHGVNLRIDFNSEVDGNFGYSPPTPLILHLTTPLPQIMVASIVNGHLQPSLVITKFQYQVTFFVSATISEASMHTLYPSADRQTCPFKSSATTAISISRSFETTSKSLSLIILPSKPPTS